MINNIISGEKSVCPSVFLCPSSFSSLSLSTSPTPEVFLYGLDSSALYPFPWNFLFYSRAAPSIVILLREIILKLAGINLILHGLFEIPYYMGKDRFDPPYKIDKRCQNWAGFHVLYLKCMLTVENIKDSYSVGKIKICSKKISLFLFLHRRVPPLDYRWKKLSTLNFSKFSKTMSKNGPTRTFHISKGTKSRKISPFGTCTKDWHAIIDQGGLIWSPPCRIGLRLKMKVKKNGWRHLFF